MPTFEISATYTVDDVFTIEADSEEEAWDLADAEANDRISDNMLPNDLYWSGVEVWDVTENE